MNANSVNDRIPSVLHIKGMFLRHQFLRNNGPSLEQIIQTTKAIIKQIPFYPHKNTQQKHQIPTSTISENRKNSHFNPSIPANKTRATIELNNKQKINKARKLLTYKLRQVIHPSRHLQTHYLKFNFTL